MNEAETRAELIDPALKAAGRSVVDASRVRSEVITLVSRQGARKPSGHIHGTVLIGYPTRDIPRLSKMLLITGPGCQGGRARAIRF